jgi:hypothetical protein
MESIWRVSTFLDPVTNQFRRTHGASSPLIEIHSKVDHPKLVSRFHKESEKVFDVNCMGCRPKEPIKPVSTQEI